jgi:hypothetical protein
MFDLSRAEIDVLAERRRHVEEEGWSKAHDDAHTDGSIAAAAACYAHPEPIYRLFRGDEMSAVVRDKTGVPIRFDWAWPRSWARRWWKPKDRRRDLVRAGSLIIAEIERLDRLHIPVKVEPAPRPLVGKAVAPVVAPVQKTEAVPS